MQRLLKSGSGWRIGWQPNATEFKGLVGSDDWALELTEAELDDFCRLLGQLVETIDQMREELMDEEAIACELASNLIWLEAEGYPNTYRLHLIVLTGRRGEGHWSVEAVPELIQAVQSLKVF
ncbi:MAG: DUF1818 family protein [Leptolyngbyaceae cyanobacterium RU_5_1]|nr:DUF1818 family protein [Leptolyngbyaceae cyanobacterium RU_5_1]